jgi:hypothetical protein
MLLEFWEEVEMARDPGPPRLDVQLHARWITEHLKNDLVQAPLDATRMPGRGVGGESTN